MTNAYEEAYQRSITDKEGFWGDAARDIVWTKPWDRVLDESQAPLYRWFAGGELNTCYNAVDRHVDEGRGDQAAIIYDSAITGAKRTISYKTLKDQVAGFAGVLASRGVGKGDRVILYMPMIPESLVAMLACARLGAIHSVVFGGFAPNELATRINDAQPKAIVAASCGIEPNRVIAYKPLVDEAIRLSAHKPDSVIVWQREEARADLSNPGDIDWALALETTTPHDCVPVAATDPLYILYTSGTTGQPKGVVRDNGGHAVALRWTMKAIYNMSPGDVFWAASDVGWVVGHSYICYAPLLLGATTLVFEGKPVGTPDAGTFWRVIAEHKVATLFTAPTAFRAIKREDPDGLEIGKYDLSSLRALFLAGERCDPATIDWAEHKLGVPVIDHWWQTETGWAIAANCLGLHLYPVKHGSPTLAAPGWDVRVLDDTNHEVNPGQIGALVCKLPLPPGTLTTLWNAEARFRQAYLADFPGYYKSGDAGFIDDEGYIYVMTRTDDIINVAGHRLSTGAMEEVLAGHPAVAECAVIGISDDLKGQVPLGFVCLKAGITTEPAQIAKECAALVRDQIGPVAAYKQTVVVPRLPKTRSGKILRGTMQKIADNEAFKMPATIDDPGILPEIEEALESIGLARKRV
ncbi:propionyl-CoA synthetase [Rhodospirillum rubrum]|uniref:AMP-dependent synthetase and ligase n=1 Tax=Rhodospirillum rubrum (strain ATCC 11170 / ATH 1.1.1 / DSM 467 / LMG 4362 / NCIMB 8255 / S1) TaxID=269796 RepID=Q2RVJ8_RHORT|nr:propionyl-CoA synthetase [Rhodospirillum rubrum]ABC21847.1 AMP-dependent synthetase and ligase [Rhodospirillum rubrum ATCC 11170]AEO47547.1 AMP-dependent synthetase and ligase [Rhodospirillum rubrum F11]MBK5953409.1 propionyl-CoA synthetase [Rhodospirillum rubrum]QXG81507.1 propionyl-CoA synthetase [Rhodospirillum rubrum]HAQ01294.1 propionyl-CoA synthetase [Rhodospirillum rubrum]